MDHGPRIEYMSAFNGTATKMLIILQPDIRVAKKFLQASFNGSVKEFITTRTGMSEEQLTKFSKIRINVVAKT